MSLFLTAEEVEELTGIKKGRTEASRKLHKHERQVAFLRTAGIPFIVNASGRPIIARAALVARHEAKPVAESHWQSNIG